MIEELINESILRLESGIGNYTDFEFVYYDGYLNSDENEKCSISEILLNSNIKDLSLEQKESLSILRNAIKIDLGVSKVLK